jgi:DNA-binding transcriptional regulator LsrR (DeoR family)
MELSESVRQTLGIQRALVLDTATVDYVTISKVAADYLSHTVTANATVGLAWSRSTRALADNLPTLPPCTIVQLCGVIPQPAGEEHNVELVRSAAHNAGAKAVTFYAPLVVPDPKTADILRKQPGIREALATCNYLTTAVVAVGMWAPGESTIYDALPPEQSALFAARGAIAETCGILLDRDGQPLHDGLDGRAIAVTIDQLRRASDVVTITTDAHRVAAVQALTRSGLVSTLITTSLVAHRLLQ